ncbi:TolC family protein [Chishuiella sp.]|uniref:TolC family protein n=1 Tax=Chishuiella sp. TaxID=1969467 RepID=UPI0028A6BAD4|nr:TolC family protein [Chishuiella sp.]
MHLKINILKKHPKIIKFIYYTLTFLLTNIINAQDSIKTKISIETLFDLLEKNNPTLNVSKADLLIYEQKTKIAKNQLLPAVTTGASAYYIGTPVAITKDFSHSQTRNYPHFGNKLSLDATQTLWNAGAVKNNIKESELENEVAQINYRDHKQQIKALTLTYYFNLFQLKKQFKVFTKNIELAEKRLKNIKKLYDQGMVTRNDVIRGELQVSNLNLSLQVLTNDATIRNIQLNAALGLPSNNIIEIDENILNKPYQLDDLDYYELALKNHPEIEASQKNIEISQLKHKIINSERIPTLSLFAGNSLQRPIITTTPVLDQYLNTWNIGVTLKFSLDNLYKTPKKLRLNSLELDKNKRRLTEVQTNQKVNLESSYIKYNEAYTQNETFKKNRDLAKDNYRIMESKYNNQLAILIDLIDASNALLEAELQESISEINIMQAYYNVIKNSGLL